VDSTGVSRGAPTVFVNAQMNAIGQSKPPVATPSQLVALMADA
jgi:hypothetical protein